MGRPVRVGLGVSGCAPCSRGLHSSGRSAWKHEPHVHRSRGPGRQFPREPSANRFEPLCSRRLCAGRTPASAGQNSVGARPARGLGEHARVRRQPRHGAPIRRRSRQSPSSHAAVVDSAPAPGPDRLIFPSVWRSPRGSSSGLIRPCSVPLLALIAQASCPPFGYCKVQASSVDSRSPFQTGYGPRRPRTRRSAATTIRATLVVPCWDSVFRIVASLFSFFPIIRGVDS